MCLVLCILTKEIVINLILLFRDGIGGGLTGLMVTAMARGISHVIHIICLLQYFYNILDIPNESHGNGEMGN